MCHHERYMRMTAYPDQPKTFRTHPGKSFWLPFQWQCTYWRTCWYGTYL